MGVLNPGLLGLLGLGAVPVIIHLLNRRRYQVVRWPAMEFLLRAQVKTRKRLRMENLLLLIVRTLAVLCFCLAATRPYLPSAAGVAGLQPERTHLYLVIDNSASMAYREGISPLLQRAVRQAEEEMDRLENDDPVTLVLTCDNVRRRDGRPVALLRATRDHGKVKDVLARVVRSEASDARLDPAAALATVLDVAEPGDPRRLLRVFSDFQRVDWAPLDAAAAAEEEAAGAAAVRAQLERLRESRFEVDAAFRQVATQPPSDLGIVGVSTQDGRSPAEGIPTAFEVVVANHGSSTTTADVSLEVDGREIGTRRVSLDGRPARAASPTTSRVTFPWTGTAGPHVALARVAAPDNRLDRNDTRRHAFRVQDRLRVLAVDGDPAPADQGWPETRLLETALSLTRGVLPVDVRVVPEADAGREEFTDADVIILANTSTLTQATWERLRRRVVEGGAIWIFLGNRTDPLAWNDVARRAETEDLLPARLEGRPRLDAENPVALDLVESSHPSLSDLTDPRHGSLFEPPLVAGWWPVQQPLADDVEVLLHFRDLDRSPALLERRVGRGRVLLSTTTADLDWSGPSLFYAPWIQETVAYLASAGEPSYDLVVNGTLTATVSAGARDLVMLVGETSQDGQRIADLEARPREDDPQGRRILHFQDTARQFQYTLRWKEPPEGGDIGRDLLEREAFWAVNLDAREGDVLRLSPEEMLRRFGSAGGTGDSEEDLEGAARSAAMGGSGDLTGTLLAAGLLLLVLEMFLASWFGRKRG